MNTGNWVLDNVLQALETWQKYLNEIWTLLTTSPQSFRGGTIWNIIQDIHGGLKAVAYALLVLFFIIGVVRTTTDYRDIKRPEQALKLFIRFAVSKGVITYSMDLLLAVFKIIRVIYRGDSDGDSASVNNWNDVLGVYAVLHSDNSSSVPVITVTDDTESDLREIFYSMNSVDFDKEILEEEDETAPEPTPDPNGTVPDKKRKTVACIYVTQSSRNYKEAAES